MFHINPIKWELHNILKLNFSSNQLFTADRLDR
nr:MAG TPA: hypothetical protein [Caudoviricetes sp.]